MAYSYTRTITIDHTKVGASDLTNFTALLSGTYSYLATVANAGLITNANGYDIIFTSDAAGANLLNWEIETYSQTDGVVNFWIKIPTISHTVDTVIYMFYTNAAINTFQGGALGTAWDANYALVYHLPNGTSLSAVDSISVSNNGTISGPTAVAGQIDGAGVWGAVSTDKITTGLTSGNATRTYEIWTFRTGPGGGSSARIFDKRTVSGQVEVLFAANGTSVFEYDRAFSGGTGVWSVSLPTDNAWHHIVLTYDSSAASNTPIYYIDGAVATLTVNTPSTGTANTNTDPYVLGNRGSDNARNWAGNLDEFRVSNSIRTAGYVTANFNNQKTPSSFYTVGNQSNVTSTTIAPNNQGLNNVSNLNNLNLRTI